MSPRASTDARAPQGAAGHRAHRRPPRRRPDPPDRREGGARRRRGLPGLADRPDPGLHSRARRAGRRPRRRDRRGRPPELGRPRARAEVLARQRRLARACGARRAAPGRVGPAAAQGEGLREQGVRPVPEATSSLVTIARAVNGTTDLTEALRLVCRELARLTLAETVAAYLLDVEGKEIRPAAAYHVPKHTLDVLTTTALPLAAQGFAQSVFTAGDAAWGDDAQKDPPVALSPFRACPHRSGLIIPLSVDD